MKRFAEIVVPSAVFVVNSVEFRHLLAFMNLLNAKRLILMFILFNVYCFTVSQIAGLKFKNKFSYLWGFSTYVFVPFFFKLLDLFGYPPILSPFISFVFGEIVLYSIFKDVFLTLEISRLAVLIALISGMVAWIS